MTKTLDDYNKDVEAHKTTMLTDAPCGLAKCRGIVLDLFAAYDAEREARVRAERERDVMEDDRNSWRRYAMQSEGS